MGPRRKTTTPPVAVVCPACAGPGALETHPTCAATVRAIYTRQQRPYTEWTVFAPIRPA